MAAIYKYSYDKSKINRFKIGKRIKNNFIIFLRNKSEIGSYYSALDKKAIHKYNGSNCIFIRIDPYVAQFIKSLIENKRFRRIEYNNL